MRACVMTKWERIVPLLLFLAFRIGGVGDIVHEVYKLMSLLNVDAGDGELDSGIFGD